MKKIIYILILLLPLVSLAQEETIKVSGTVYDTKAAALVHTAMVINKTTGRGKFSEDGTFSFSCNKNDSIYISVHGYELLKFSFKDSLSKPNYTVRLPLKVISYHMNVVTVFPERDLKAIKEDIDKLGYNEKDYMLSEIDAFESPITFLYQTFNRHQQKERLAIELENDWKRRQLLKELFAKYVKHDIIDLENERFDDFIDFCAVSDTQMKQMSQYDFIMYIKERYRLFAILKSEDYYDEKAK